jgi:hypothetical protein
MKKENLHKGRKFELSMEVGGVPFNYPGIVEESWGSLCLVKEMKAGPGGGFSDYGIYQIVKNGKDEEYLSAVEIDYSKNDIPRYTGNEVEVRARFTELVTLKILREEKIALLSEREQERQERILQAEKLRAEKILFFNTRIEGLRKVLKEKAGELPANELIADNEVRDMISDMATLNELKKLI